MSTDLPSQINAEVLGLDDARQRQVLAYVRDLKRAQKGISGSELKQHAGTFSEADAKSMIEAIEAGCERIDPDGW